MIPRGTLVVSCQAREDNPLHGAAHMAAMARAAEQGGAGGIRANGPDDVAAIRAVTKLPLIGLFKRDDDGFPVYITPDFACARAVAQAGADIVAVDATARPRRGEPIVELIARIRRELHVLVMADIATHAQGLAAEAWGVDYVATTMSGYTEDKPPTDGPDLDLVASLAKACRVPVIAEGRFETAAQVAQAFDRGAHAVVVGTAITNPREITRRFAAAARA
jgi:putative N-acetylmannosamine-6-phosphate epimerase